MTSAPLPLDELRADLAVPRFAQLYPTGHLADWNTGDWFCVRVLGPLIETSGERCARSIAAWVIRKLSRARPDLAEAFLARRAADMSPEARKQVRGRRRR